MSTQIEENRKHTPMMEQWHRCKLDAKDAVLFFRMGDFYEAFYEDAKILSKELDLTLTKRQGIPMSGVPWHASSGYIEKLVEKGYKIAVAEQMEDPKQAKGLVDRKVVRFVTPGTYFEKLSLEKSHNFIASLTQVGSIFGLASLDLSTGCFQAMEIEELSELANELYRLDPREIVLSKKFSNKHQSFLNSLEGIVFSEVDESRFEHKTAYDFLVRHFKVHHLDGFGLKGRVFAINAAGGLLSYVQEDLSLPVNHIQEIKSYSTSGSLCMDKATQRNLELVDSLHEKSKNTTLLSVIDKTRTPMGGRLIREWIKKPLMDPIAIEKRLDAVELCFNQGDCRMELQEELSKIQDLERLMMRISTGYCSPRDLVSLKNSLICLPTLKEILDSFEAQILEDSFKNLYDFKEATDLIERALSEEAPLRLSDGNLFKENYSPELDQLKKITRGGKDWLMDYQCELREKTGIKTLRVNYNKIFGYYIEVSKNAAASMPEYFIRKQTLVNSERFISSELKEYETKVLSAEQELRSLEEGLFQKLREKIAVYEKQVFQAAAAIAFLDVVLSLSQVAKTYDYCRPIVDQSTEFIIENGRHPSIEIAVGLEKFIPNNIHFFDKKSLMLITGPNMAGKSTYIRQVALITILAQMGSFVPASFAHIGIVDHIFTRIGASDDLSRGQSTFMVEMSETANILRTSTARSLVILDEIGRGTGTYDGVSIAWAVAEFLIAKKSKTLFATHYWELTELETHFPEVMNIHAAVSEADDTIVFLHKIKQGGTDKSYGIHVAKLAGIPLGVIQRAQDILKKLEARQESPKPIKKEKKDLQLTFFNSHLVN